MTDRHPDVECIQQAWERLARAWSEADPAASASIWAVESDHRRLIPSLPAWSGREALEKALTDAFARRAGRTHSVMTCRLESVRFVRPDVAVVDGTIEVREADGPPHGTRRIAEPFTSVMTKTGHEWLIAASRVGAVVTD